MSANATRIVLVRHGETEWNRAKRIQGQLDFGLSELGRVQARQLAGRLGAQARQGERFDALYSSDLGRAQQTAEPLAGALGLSLGLLPGLRERMFGAFQGHDAEEIRVKFPDAYLAWQSRDPQFAPPGGGESQQVFQDRVVAVLRQLVARHAGQRVICVAHGGVLDCAYRHARQIPLALPREQALLNASLNEIVFDEQGATVSYWADVAHLDNSADDGLVQDKVDPRVV